MVGMKPTIKIKWPEWKSWQKVISVVDSNKDDPSRDCLPQGTPFNLH